MEKKNLIFLCTHNQARSQMAEAFLRDIGSDIYNVYSAGFEPREVHPLAKKVMEEKGYNLTKHYSKDLKEYLGDVHFDIVITLCQRANRLCPIIPGVEKRIFWDLEDPSNFNGNNDEKLEKFREIRDNIEEKIIIFLKQIKKKK